MESEGPVFVHPSAVVDDGVVLGSGTKIWHFCHLMGPSALGKNCNLGQNVVVSPQVRLGNGVKIQNNVSIYTGVECEDDVFIGPSVVFTNVINPRSFISRKSEFKKTLVRLGASIGANSTLVCGVEIGRYAFVGAGSVVTRDVPAFGLVYGNPARQHGWMSKAGHKLHFDSENQAICPETGEVYLLSVEGVQPITESIL
ncbi:MAG TPA: acyltransferase [Catalimonadaceae bacterium]|nr:acyltransferase [Catalimonadaceae bacterium]